MNLGFSVRFVRKSRLYVLLLLLGLLLLSSLLWLPFNPYDEGIILVGASRIVGGEKPYLDFWTLYPPGQFYTLAWLFAGFESAAWIERCYDLLVKSLIGLTLFVLVDNATRQRRLALLIWLLAMVWISYRDFVLYPIFPCVLLVMFSLAALLQYLHEPRGYLLPLSSASLVLSACYRVDLGVLASAALLVGLLFRCWVQPAKTGSLMVRYVLCCLLMAVPLLWLLHFLFGIERLFEQLILAPASLIPEYRALPYPAFGLSGKKLPFYIFPALLLVGTLVSLRDLLGQKKLTPLTDALLLVSLVGGVFLNQVRVRSDLIHLMPSALFAITVLGLLLVRAQGLLPVGRRTVVARALVALLLLMTFYKPAYEQVKEFVPVLHSAEDANHYRDRFASIEMPADMRVVLDWLNKHTAHDDSIYVGVTNHDRFLVNDVALYFLAMRGPATRYHELHPGVTTSDVVQQVIIAELTRQPPAALVLADNFHPEANRSAEDAQVDLLDQYIRTHYEPCFTSGKFQIWQSRSR